MCECIEELEARIMANDLQMKRLYNENIDLRDQINLTEKYSEKEETFIFGKGKTKRKETFLVGRRHWSETFKDGDTGEGIDIERSEVCRVNGKPADRFGREIEKYELTDI